MLKKYFLNVKICRRKFFFSYSKSDINEKGFIFVINNKGLLMKHITYLLLLFFLTWLMFILILSSFIMLKRIVDEDVLQKEKKNFLRCRHKSLEWTKSQSMYSSLLFACTRYYLSCDDLILPMEYTIKRILFHFHSNIDIVFFLEFSFLSSSILFDFQSTEISSQIPSS